VVRQRELVASCVREKGRAIWREVAPAFLVVDSALSFLTSQPFLEHFCDSTIPSRGAEWRLQVVLVNAWKTC
jgi:hypothetical protein